MHNQIGIQASQQPCNLDHHPKAANSDPYSVHRQPSHRRDTLTLNPNMIVFPWKTNLCAEAHKSNPKSIFHSHMQPQCCMCCSYEQPDRSLQCLPCGPAITNVLIGQLDLVQKVRF